MKICISPDVDKDIIQYLLSKKNTLLLNQNEFKRQNFIFEFDLLITKYKDINYNLINSKKKKIRLKYIQLTTSDYSRINILNAKKRNIIVTNNNGANSTSVAEHTFGLIIIISRNLLTQINQLKNKKWNNLKNINLELENKTIGIVGLGNVGLKVAKLAKSFNMKVFYNDIKKNNYAFVKKNKKLYF